MFKTNLNNANPAALAGFLNGRWQVTDYVPDDFGNLVRDASVAIPNFGGTEARTTVAESVGAAQRGKLITFNNASAVAVALDDPTTLNANLLYVVFLKNLGVGTATFTPGGSATIDGNPTLVLTTGQGTTLFSNGTNYFTLGSTGGGGGTWGSITGTLSAQTDLQTALNAKLTNPMTTKGDIVAAAAGGTANRLGVGTDGQMVVADSSQTLGLRYSDLPAFLVGGSPGAPTSSQFLGGIVARGYSITFPGNFSGSGGTIFPGGANPTATATCQIYKNTTNIGTMAISTSGVFTFTTTGGASVTLNIGDSLSVFAPASVDATLALFGFTIFGNKGLVASNGIINPAVVWKGAYSGATAYNTYEIVSYRGGVYICVTANTGNAPTVDGNNTYWQFVMGDGWRNRGVYSGATAYVENDVVQFIATGTSYSSYLCISPTTGHDPTNATYWTVVAQAGIDGSVTPAQLQQQAFEYFADTGSANAIVVTPSPAFVSYVAGDALEVKIAADNTGATTINVSGLGTKNVINADGTALSAGSIKTGGIYRFTYNGTAFQLIGAGAGGASASAKYVLGATDGSLANGKAFGLIYNGPDTPPVSPGTLDDEFEDATFNTNGKWTWVNQGGATAVQSKSWLGLTAPHAGGDNWRMIVQAAPATPWEVTARFALVQQWGNYRFSGIVLRESSTGKLIGWCWVYNTTDNGVGNGIEIVNMNSSTSFNSQSLAIPQMPIGSNPYFRVKDDGTNLIYSLSYDGVNFTVLKTLGRTAFLAGGANQVGIGVDNNDNSGTTWDLTLGCDFFRRTV